MENRIVVRNFWYGYMDGKDACNIGFIQKLFYYSDILRPYGFSPNVVDGNILFEGHYNYQSDLHKKPWKYRIHCSLEPNSHSPEGYDLVLHSIYSDNIVYLPPFVYYMNSVDISPLRSFKPRRTIPPKFCCFIVSNPCCDARNTMFDRLNAYKRVDSYGLVRANCTRFKHPYWSKEFRQLLSQYKFVICFENNRIDRYATEKIVNPYLARIIPIYSGSHETLKIWNRDSMVFLEHESEEEFQRVVDRVKYLDTNDSAYLEVVNTHPISWDEYEANYSLSLIGKQIDARLSAVSRP